MVICNCQKIQVFICKFPFLCCLIAWNMLYYDWNTDFCTLKYIIVTGCILWGKKMSLIRSCYKKIK